jgi:hypothetical protein
MHQDTFVVDRIEYRERVKRNEEIPKYELKNFNYYFPKLDKDFYVNYFTSELLFEIDVLEVDEFLDVQFGNTNKVEFLIKCIRYKILPLIENIIDNPETGFAVDGRSQGIELEYDFYEIGNKIENYKYNTTSLQHRCRFSMVEDLKMRKTLLFEYTDRVLESLNGQNKNSLNWGGKPSHLAIIVSYLVDMEYIIPPYNQNGDINFSELSKQVLESFNITQGASFNTLRAYLNPDTDKYLGLNNKFRKEGFKIPHKGEVS